MATCAKEAVAVGSGDLDSTRRDGTEQDWAKLGLGNVGALSTTVAVGSADKDGRGCLSGVGNSRRPNGDWLLAGARAGTATVKAPLALPASSPGTRAAAIATGAAGATSE
mmetsp:Transcript_118364/g.280956  ORF Transcript_118364/g.280956 Transcript_118364/m.280956 type:complete len:110 (+) Transcript_118364:500-829(+)